MLHAKDGQEAIDYLELPESEIALVIIELELPVVSGLDVIWRLVRRKRPKPQRIIALGIPWMNSVPTPSAIRASASLDSILDRYIIR